MSLRDIIDRDRTARQTAIVANIVCVMQVVMNFFLELAKIRSDKFENPDTLRTCTKKKKKKKK